MKPEKQRSVIAETFPKTIGLSSSGAWMWSNKPGVWHCCYPENDPLSDLNAMHELWSLLPSLPMVGKEVSNDKIALRSLAGVVSPKNYPDWPNCDNYPIGCVLKMGNATAQQYAEAIIRFLEKWEEEA